MDLRFDEQHLYRFDEAVHITPNSELFRALDINMGRTVALKRVNITGTDAKMREANYKRALQEVKTMVQISEMTARIPNIYCDFYDQDKGQLYIVMQWINGETLSEKMKSQVPLPVFLKWMQELCDILETMSKRNFRHKDIKPDNIMFNQSDDLYLIDFNISVSVPNQMEGTPLYKAPEMDFGSITADREKSDMFSIGVMLYQFVTGTIPQRTVHYDIYDAAGENWDFFRQPIELKEINSELNRIIVRLMEYSPHKRFRSYSELKNELKRAERAIRNEGKQSGQRNGKNV